MARVTPGAVAGASYDLAVVGAGAAGLAVATSCADAGLRVLLVERGRAEPAPGGGPLDEIAPGSPHDPLAEVSARALGGTLHLWGGRCVPLDPEDFAGGAWPFGYEEYRRWVEPAARLLGVEPVFEAPPPEGWGAVPGLRADRLERLSPRARLRALLSEVARHPGIDVLAEAEAVGVDWRDAPEGPAVAALRAWSDGRGLTVRCPRVALACGGLETTRILLAEQALRPALLGGRDGPLGRHYMGHLTGAVAEIAFARASDRAAFAFGPPAAPARRRMTPEPAGALGVAFWVESLPAADPRHRSGELSAKHLLRGGRPRGAHLANALADPGGVAAGAASALRARLARGHRTPDRLLARGAAPCRLAYHAEHAPCRSSRVTLAARRGPSGAPGLDVAFSYGARSIDAVVQAHRALADALGRAALAHVRAPDALGDEVEARARDGYHQIGLARMAHDPRQGALDAHGRAHGARGLHVASAAAFPTSGQANPTLSVVAMALRLARRLVAEARGA